MKFHHIGYLTNNFKKSIKEFKEINYVKKGKVITDNILQVKIQFISNSNNIIELVNPFKKITDLLVLLKKKIMLTILLIKLKIYIKKLLN